MRMRVYAVVAAGTRVEFGGVHGERLRLLTEGSIAAIVGAVRRPAAASRRNLRAYDRVLRRLGACTEAIVPARFNTSVADEAEVRFILRTRRRALKESLRRVRGRAQMTVRLAAGDGSGGAHRAAMARSQPPAAARLGTAYLRSRQAAAAAKRQIPVFDPLRAFVERWIRDERIERRGRLATVYHLIPRASAPAYLRALDRAATKHGTRIVVGGPYLPYAFASPMATDG